MSKTRPSRVANPIAVRRFTVAGEPGREVVLTLGKPRPSLGDWACSVLIEGLPRARRRRVHGVDALQALQLAMQHARAELDASGLDLLWLDPHTPGDVGLPLLAPVGYGLPFQRRVERYMQRASLEMAGAITATIQERARLRASRSGPPESE